MPSCGIRRAHADENGPSSCFAGSAKRLDRSCKPGPFHRFTISKSGRDSLPGDGGMQRDRLSRFEKGTIVHLMTFTFGIDLNIEAVSAGEFVIFSRMCFCSLHKPLSGKAGAVTLARRYLPNLE